MTDELASEIFKKNVVANQTNRDNAGTALADEDVDTVHYWLYSLSALMWILLILGING